MCSGKKHLKAEKIHLGTQKRLIKICCSPYFVTLTFSVRKDKIKYKIAHALNSHTNVN